MKRSLIAVSLVMVLMAVACSTPDRLKVDDLKDESFGSLLEALEYAGCPDGIGIAVGLSGPWPPLTEESAIQQWRASWSQDWDSGYGEPSVAVEVSPGIWLIGADGGVVVAGIDENQKMAARCENG